MKKVFVLVASGIMLFSGVNSSAANLDNSTATFSVLKKDDQTKALKKKEKELKKRKKNLKEREKMIDREQSILNKEQKLNKKEKKVARKEFKLHN